MTALLDTTQPFVTVGIDAHEETHHVVVPDGNGVSLADKKFPANSGGYNQLLTWATGFRSISRVGIESTGSYAAGLTRHLLVARIDVIEVNSPTRTRRPGKAKTMPSMRRRPEAPWVVSRLLILETGMELCLAHLNWILRWPARRRPTLQRRRIPYAARRAGSKVHLTESSMLHLAGAVIQNTPDDGSGVQRGHAPHPAWVPPTRSSAMRAW